MPGARHPSSWVLVDVPGSQVTLDGQGQLWQTYWATGSGEALHVLCILSALCVGLGGSSQMVSHPGLPTSRLLYVLAWLWPIGLLLATLALTMWLNTLACCRRRRLVLHPYTTPLDPERDPALGTVVADVLARSVREGLLQLDAARLGQAERIQALAQAAVPAQRPVAVRLPAAPTTWRRTTA